MNKKAIWWIVGVVIVIIIIILALMGMGSGTGSNTNTSSTTSGNNVQSANTQTGAAMSLKDIFSAGTSQQCAFSVNTDGGSSAGTVYVTNGHMRGDFTANTSQGAIASHMITDGQTAYVWTDNQAQGFKMSFTSMSSAGMKGQSNGAPSADTKTNYSCSGWAVDSSKFDLPANITFQDMSAMMNASGSMGAGANQCSMCNSITNASAKAQCLAALHC